MEFRTEVIIRFTVKTEFVPGLFYNPQDFATITCNNIKHHLMAYKPIVLEAITIPYKKKA